MTIIYQVIRTPGARHRSGVPQRTPVPKKPRDFLGRRAKDAHFSLSPAIVIPIRERSVPVLRLNFSNSGSTFCGLLDNSPYYKNFFFCPYYPKLRHVLKSNTLFFRENDH
jgi:hypothetical protein